MVQFGGQNAVNLAVPIHEELIAAGCSTRILGTSPDSMDIAEDRDRFSELLRKLDIPSPPNSSAYSIEEARTKAAAIGYPVLVRPSYVLGGRAMEIVHDEIELESLHEGGGPGEQEPPGADRFVPPERDRTRRRCGLRRRGCPDRRDHGAHRGGRGPFRGLGLRDPHPVALPCGDRKGEGLHDSGSRSGSG